MNVPNVIEKPAQGAASYERDFYAWAFEQAALLREGRFGELDIANIAEELETLGRSEFRAYVSAYRIVLLHLLKWDGQPERRSRSWWTSITLHRERVREIVAENPSLKARTGKAIASAYREARLMAADETGLPLERFPETCPYDADSILTRPVERD